MVYSDVNLISGLMLFLLAVHKDARIYLPLPCPPLAPSHEPRPHVRLETKAEGAEPDSPSTAHLSSSLGLKEYSGFHLAIQNLDI